MLPDGQNVWESSVGLSNPLARVLTLFRRDDFAFGGGGGGVMVTTTGTRTRTRMGDGNHDAIVTYMRRKRRGSWAGMRSGGWA